MIVSLNEQIEALKKKPAADFKETSKQEDELAGDRKELSEVTKEANRLRVMQGKAPIK
jgi:hypothetical protein